MRLKLHQAEACRYDIDEGDRIVDVDDAWVAFAERNGGIGLTREAVIGQSVHAYIAGWATSDLYARLFQALRRSAVPAKLTFRCDSPDRIRRMQLEMASGAGGIIRIKSRLLAGADRPHIPLLDPKTRHDGKWQIICSICLRIKAADGTWREIEDALPLPHDDPTPGLPQLSHDVCPQCETEMKAAISNCESAAH